jgi:DNA primase
MRYSDELLDEIRARLPVSEVVRMRVALKKQGREWRGLSPFNKEKTPSFFVNDQKGFYHDFSSGKSGDQFKFLMETEGLSFPEAVERLAATAGVPLPKSSREEENAERKRKSLHEVMELATKFYESQFNAAAGKIARDYAAKRGLETETLREFRIGYAPSSRYALKEYLGSKGVLSDDMIATGLLVSGDDIPVPYDRFRDRLIIPIHDARGRVVAFGGRALSEDAQAKYLNSPETPLFHKGSIVFNFHRARQPAHDDGAIVVVEGYLDAIAIYQAGMKSVVASMGTAFTEEQIATMWRLSDEPIVCFDADRAGVAAVHRSIDRILPALKAGRTFRFAMMHGGKDPDELIRDKGLDAFKSILSGSLSLWDLLWEREVPSNSKYETPDSQAALETRFNGIVRTIKDDAVQKAYLRRSRVQLANLFWDIEKGRRGLSSKGLVQKELRSPLPERQYNIQKVLLGLLVHYPGLLEEKLETIERVQFSDKLEYFRRALYDLLITHGDVSVRLIYDQLKPSFYEVLQEIHGEQGDDHAWGHRLFLLFPILKHDPPLDFVSRCVDNFAAILQLEQMAAEIEGLRMLPEGSARFEEVSERLLNLVREYQTQKATATSVDLALAEEASEIKRIALGPANYERVAA